MTELLFFKWDHSTQSSPTPSTQNLAYLPRRFDLIEARNELALGTGAIVGTVLTITTGMRGSLHVGDSIEGPNILSGTVITSFGTGFGGVGTYNINKSQTVVSQTISVPWKWGNEELTNSLFRIIAWPTFIITTHANQFLSPLLPELDVNMRPTTYWQYRAFFLNILDVVNVPLALRNYWQDDTRAAAKFFTTLTPLTVINAIKGARTRIPIT